MGRYLTRPVIYWPIIGAVAAVFTKSGGFDRKVWTFWILAGLAVGLFMEWRRFKRKVFGIIAAALSILLYFLGRDAIQQPGTLIIKADVPVLARTEMPRGGLAAVRQEDVIAMLKAGTKVEFVDQLSLEDYVAYEVEVNGTKGFVINDGKSIERVDTVKGETK